MSALAYLAKLFEQQLLPASLIAGGILVCLIVAVRRRDRLVSAALAGLFGVYYLFTTWPLAAALMATLERQFPATANLRASAGVEAIVILAGNAAAGPEAERRGELNEASWRRLYRGIELYANFGRTVPILFSGGSARPDVRKDAVILAQQFARKWGIREEHFWTESRSHNTYSSGLEVKKILENKSPDAVRHRVVLITSAWHMPRAVGVFAKQGIDIIPAPCDYASRQGGFHLRDFLPSHEALSTFTTAVRELAGLLLYRMQDRL